MLRKSFWYTELRFGCHDVTSTEKIGFQIKCEYMLQWVLKRWTNLTVLICCVFCSGEAAFKSLSIPYGWARFPMIRRVKEISQHIPITMIYGSRSWISNNTGYHVKYLRHPSFVDVRVSCGCCVRIEALTISCILVFLFVPIFFQIIRFVSQAPMLTN